jgi:hypothetical protein
MPFFLGIFLAACLSLCKFDFTNQSRRAHIFHDVCLHPIF